MLGKQHGEIVLSKQSVHVVLCKQSVHVKSAGQRVRIGKVVSCKQLDRDDVVLGRQLARHLQCWTSNATRMAAAWSWRLAARRLPVAERFTGESDTVMLLECERWTVDIEQLSHKLAAYAANSVVVGLVLDITTVDIRIVMKCLYLKCIARQPVVISS